MRRKKKTQKSVVCMSKKKTRKKMLFITIHYFNFGIINKTGRILFGFFIFQQIERRVNPPQPLSFPNASCSITVWQLG
jgi:hypothetical protein